MTGRVATVGQRKSRELRPTAKALPGDARSHNRSLILRTLFHSGPASRADLARITQLTRVTVSDLVTDLMSAGLVESAGQRPGTHIGKPATLVRLKADAAHIVTIDVSEIDKIRGAILDLSGHVLERSIADMAGATEQGAVAQIAEFGRRLLGRVRQPVLGVGVGSPGVVDQEGTVRQAPNLSWVDVPLAQILTERLGHPVYVANDANAAALAEFTFGGAPGDGLMVVTIGSGVGAGIVVDGALVQGCRDAAGELGHLTAIDDGQRCACGRYGCLETILSAPSLRACVAGLDAGSAEAKLTSVGRRLGLILAPVVSALNLEQVLLSGPPELLSGSLAGAALQTIRERTISHVGEALELRMASLGRDVVLAGAAVLVLSGQLGVS